MYFQCYPMYEHSYSVKVLYCIQVKQKIDTVRIHIFSWRAREKHDRLTGMKSKSILTTRRALFSKYHLYPCANFIHVSYNLWCFKGPVLAIMLCAPLLLFWFSQERGVIVIKEFYSHHKQKPQNFQHHKNGRQEIAACNAPWAIPGL